MLLSLLLPLPAISADGLLDRLYDDAVLAATATMTSSDVEIVEQANTERFTLIIGKHTSGTHVTLTLRSIGAGAQVFVTVATDSPKNTALENQLLDAIRK